MDDEVPPTITRRREATRQRLLDAAAQVFAETGFDAASVEAVCERAGYTRGAFYSNFDSKEELFLELCTRTAQAQITLVRERVGVLDSEGVFAGSRDDVLSVVRQVLESTLDERWGVLLLSEMRLHALRHPAFAAPFLAQEEALHDSVRQLVVDIARANRMTMRLSPEESTHLLLLVWKSSTENAVLEGLDDTATRRHLERAIASVAELVLVPAD